MSSQPLYERLFCVRTIPQWKVLTLPHTPENEKRKMEKLDKLKEHYSQQ